MPYTLYDYDDFSKALRSLRRAIKKNPKAKSYIWTGPDKFHSSISAIKPPPSWYLREDGMKYEKERGRTIEDIITSITFDFAYHQAAVKEGEFTKQIEKMLESERKLSNTYFNEFIRLRDKYEPLTEDQIANGKQGRDKFIQTVLDALKK